MSLEIEKKFLVGIPIEEVERRNIVKKLRITQAYINKDPLMRIRLIRNLIGNATQAILTIKKFISAEIRHEFEFGIPLSQASEMISLMSNGIVIEKTRYVIRENNLDIEVDIYDKSFYGEKTPLITADIEFQTQNQQFDKPDWLADEITGSEKYSNYKLAVLNKIAN